MYEQAGSLLAIEGPSGGGKTTLLHSLAGRIDPSLQSTTQLSGTIVVNGAKLPVNQMTSFNDAHTRHSTCVIGMVQQNDFLNGNLTVRLLSFIADVRCVLCNVMCEGCLTVRETLRMAGLLRLRLSANDESRRDLIVEERVIRLMDELGLSGVADRRVGAWFDRTAGLSGGEKRRVSIGVEAIAEPDILFCDEPTTGLDANAALHVVRILREMARNKRMAIVCTIHQPSPRVITYFHSLLLLASGGRTVYFGPTVQAVDYFHRLMSRTPTLTPTALIDSPTVPIAVSSVDSAALPDSKRTAPAAVAAIRLTDDFVLDLIGTKGDVLVQSFNESIEYLQLLRTFDTVSTSVRSTSVPDSAAAAPPKTASIVTSDAKNGPALTHPADWVRQFKVLCDFNVKLGLRDYSRYYFQFAIIVLYTLIVGGVYYGLSHDVIRARVYAVGITWIPTITQYVPVFKIMFLLDDYQLFTFHRSNRSYSLSAHTAAEVLIGLTFELLCTVPPFWIAYSLEGLPFDEAEAAIITLLSFVLMYQYATAIVLLVTLFFPQSLIGAVVVSQFLVSTVSFYTASTFIINDHAPSYWVWWREASAANYCMLAATKAIFRVSNNLFSCNGLLIPSPPSQSEVGFRCLLPQFPEPFQCGAAPSSITPPAPPPSPPFPSGECMVTGVEAFRVVKSIDADTAESPWIDLLLATVIVIALRIIVVFLRAYPPIVIWNQ